MRLFDWGSGAAALAAVAETAYVTDNLRLGLHEAEDTSDRAFRSLESGQAMEILIRDRNYANVRLPDGTEGWVKNAYLVDDKPAKLIVAETQAERDALAAELEQATKAALRNLLRLSTVCGPSAASLTARPTLPGRSSSHCRKRLRPSRE